MTFQTTKQFAEYWLTTIVSDAMQKQYQHDWSFDFRFTTQELPFDWDKEVFINLFKEGFSFSLKKIYLDFVEGKYICSGRIMYDFKPSIGSNHQSDTDFMNQCLAETFKVLNSNYPLSN